MTAPEEITSLKAQLKDMNDQFFAVSGQLGEAREKLLENLRIQSSREDRFKEEALIIARKAQELEQKLATEERMRRTMESAHGEILTECVKLRAENKALGELLESATQQVEYLVGNPSAWGAYDEETSDRLRLIAQPLRAHLNKT